MYKNRFFLSATAVLLVAATPISSSLATGRFSTDIENSVHAYYADEHNTTPTTPTGNRILEIDIENMTLVNELPVEGLTNHHADSGFSSKVYAVPKGSGFVNSVKLKHNGNGGTSMSVIKKIPLIHKPRSGDAYNASLGVILMTAKNRPMGSLIDTVTDEVVGTIGENVDCTLVAGGRLLAQADPNNISHQCVTPDYGGDQVSGHPYWLTSNLVAIVDRTNRQISVYRVTKNTAGNFRTALVSHTSTRTSIHQIVPRDRTGLPRRRQSNFYAIEEGSPNQDIPPALLKLRLTRNGLRKVQRVSLGRYVNNYFNTNYSGLMNTDCDWAANNLSGWDRKYYLDYQSGLNTYKNQDVHKITRPAECINTQTQGGHNADFDNNKRHLYIGTKEGHVFIVDVFRMRIKNIVNTGTGYGNGAGSGHVVFIPGKDLAIVTNHTAPYMTAINTDTFNKIQDIPLNFNREGIFSSVQSHTGYASSDGQYYYNFWTDGGVYYKIDTGSLSVVDSLYTGGIPIQGSYIKLGNIDVVMDIETRDDSAVTTAGMPVTIDAIENDTGSSLSITSVSDPDNGTAEIINNKIVYTPAPDNETEVLEYEVIDENGKINEGEITVSVDDQPSAPTGASTSTESLNETPIAGETIEFKPEVDEELGTRSNSIPVESSETINDSNDPNGTPVIDNGSGVINNQDADVSGG